MTGNAMEFVLALHSHLPYVLNHGRWPHGSDWLCEAALDTYLPLLETLEELSADGTPAPLTIGFTPVLANQLASRAFAREMEAFFAQRLAVCDEAPAALAAAGEGGGDAALVPLVAFWKTRLRRLQALFRTIDADLVSAFRHLQERGRLEIIGSAATHGYLPLLARDESIRLQLAVGREEHRRLFGAAPAGCWLPECAYRRRGKWAPLPGRGQRVRPGIEEHLADAGFRYFFTDAHLARAGNFLGAYGDIPLGAERFDAERHDPAPSRPAGQAVRSPYRGYRVSAHGARGPVAALVRDPRSSTQIWSRHHGYPGDEWYLEFHKIRWPGGLKLWRVSGANVDLGAKRPYEPPAAIERAMGHASHFVHLLESVASQHRADGDGVIVAPFDTELFGHWWFEGADFLAATYRALRGRPGGRVCAVTASQHLEAHPPRMALRLAEGSWGANGDHSMWLNERTAWTWPRLWSLEDAFWDVAPAALAAPAARPVLAQAARELLLAQASDWQFIISTGAVVDYAERRFTLHCDDAERLVRALAEGLAEGGDGAPLESARHLADALARRDDLFPDVLAAVTEALGR